MSSINLEKSTSPSLAHLLFRSLMLFASALLLVVSVVIFGLNYFSTYEKVESELLGAAEILDKQLEQGVAPDSLEIPNAFFHRFGKADRDHAYWQVWDKSHNVLAAHGKVPKDLRPRKEAIPTSGKHPYVTRKDGTHFELTILTATNDQLVVGRPLAKEFDGFVRLFLWLLLLFGVGLAIAALIAWRLVSAIAKPIESFAATVADTDHSNLNRRLSTSQPTQEMNLLATAFNAMLSDLQSAFDKQTKFTADAAHELRTPLAIISGQCELSLSKERDAAYYRGAIATCNRVAEHMTGLVNKLLILSKLDTKQETSPSSITQIDAIIDEVVQSAASIADKRRIQIETSILPAQVLIDETHLRQVLLNLLGNAIQFSRAEGKVFVSAQPEGSLVCIRVRDEGEGIAPEELAKVFDRFYQTDKSRTSSMERGVGLGLSIASEIVTQAGGNLTIESQLGIGTTATVSLPRIA